MRAKRTPGPWARNIKPATKYPTIYAGRNTHVATVDTRRPAKEVEANIDLIAAAPDLLAALHLIDESAVLHRWANDAANDDAEWERRSALVEAMSNAMAKAEGEAVP